ncbi:MAG: alpha/beta hydrolase [Oscillospiraceae bacterium]|jgi:pimeloyl-ACP methyl ester carboxylesterase|nr:alpha/beta hydrolase [Oscillospiraceae bacterium]
MLNTRLHVTLGGVKQLIHIQSANPKRPVLLFLHGGPGVVSRLTGHPDLLDAFTLVSWDQRGTGGSWRGVKTSTLSVRQYTDDAAELLEWLCKTFRKDKIFVMGGSWGSELGTYLAYRYPARVAAFVGFGQVVDGAKNEELSYNFAHAAALAAGDADAVAELESIGPPVNGLYKGGLKGLLTQRKIMMRYGGYSPDEKRSGMWKGTVKPILFSRNFTPYEILGILVGGIKLGKAMLPTMGEANLAKDCPHFDVPYFIFDGRLDHNTPAELVEDYFEAITAPRKELIWFENAGHNPLNDEPDVFKYLLRKKLGEVAAQWNGEGVVV